MNRTLGFFLGSAVVFAMLVLILGQPVTLAPPVDRDRLPGADASTTVVKSPMPQPAAEPEAPQSPIPPVQASTAPPPVQPAPAPEVTGTSLSTPEPDSATAPVGVGQQDENKMVEAWLASSATPPADNVVAGTEAAAGQASLQGADTAAQAVAGVTESGWFPVWDPFHSELSANAFARRLERVTGLDYRVIKTAPAEYRVTVGYTSEEQRIANLNLIEEATGLMLSGGSP